MLIAWIDGRIGKMVCLRDDSLYVFLNEVVGERGCQSTLTWKSEGVNFVQLAIFKVIKM